MRPYASAEHDDPAAAAATALKIEAPCRPGCYRTPEELRYDLPFAGELDSLLYISRLQTDKWYTQLQYHDHFELSYIAEGCCCCFLDGSLFEARTGDLFVTKPSELHYAFAAGGGRLTLYTFGLRFPQLRRLETDFYKLGRSRLAADKLHAAAAYGERILDELGSRGPHAALMAQAAVTGLLVHTLRCYLGDRSAGDPDPAPLTPVVRHILDLLHGGRSGRQGGIDELALAANVSRAHLDREFKRCLGIPIGAYARQLQLDRARQLLRQTAQSVTEIAEALDFVSVQAFSLFFKRHTSMSPQEYRSGSDENGL